MPTLKTAILTKLLRRRATVQKQLDELLSKPASYSIQGSYSQTSQDADTLREELAAIDAQIRNVRTGGNGGIARVYPDYSADV